MQVYVEDVRFKTKGEIDIIDLTREFNSIVKKSTIKNGLFSGNVVGSTGALTAIEYEPRVLNDFKDILEKLVPKGAGYRHDEIDSNAHSHLRASLIGPSITFTISNGTLQLGTWQQPVFVCLDVRPRTRRVTVTIIGD